MTSAISDLASTPPDWTISTYETVTVAIDTISRLAVGITSPISPVVTLINNNGSGDEITLVSGPTVVGSKVLQEIVGSSLQAGFSYLLVVQFGDGGGNTQVGFTGVNCPI